MGLLTTDAWRQLSPAEKEALVGKLREAVQYGPTVPWECDDPSCSGQPHAGVPGPHARPDQRPPGGDWLTWLLLGGRGSGKTRTGVGWVYNYGIQLHPRGALVAPTAGDGRDVMVEGESGLLAKAPRGQLPRYEPSKRRVTFRNGAIATVYSADEPDRLRGPQHGWAWCDELAAWSRLQDAWDMLLFGMRLGPHPRIVATTTPKPKPLVRKLVKDPTCHVTASSTYANLANLAPSFRDSVLQRYEGTRLGQQELMGQLLVDTPGALWKWDQFERPGFRLDPGSEDTAARLAACHRGVVGVDPAVTSDEGSDGTGLVAVCTDGSTGYVLASKRVKETPYTAMRTAVDLALACDLDGIVVERNNGGDYLTALARQVVSDHPDRAAQQLRISTTWATRGKKVRAQPIAGLYEQQRIHHVGQHPALETELTEWSEEDSKADSPDLMDALVWGLTYLMGRPAAPPARAVAT